VRRLTVELPALTTKPNSLKSMVARSAPCLIWVIPDRSSGLCLPVDVRFAPKATEVLRCREMTRCAMCGRLRVGKSFLHVLQAWSVQPCVRPINAVHMTAGHNTLRGSGPGQKPAFDNAVAHVGCPDRRIDRLCNTCCSPSPTFTLRRVSARSRYAASATGSL
jgi:hypothetical protein